ncbi:CbiX/SirB N-terminal domain-containing protein [Paracoccus sp. S-4012]|uniref:CbiX/SirB N-terminal domain-containing protein n=1 Tax=Paracoccus sp. S-4012 TaxID=2665648 RepID=UPI0018A1D2B3|nr:CbiX/SirB N-terminal domain-containing protein [Paracoccus sp. S-4012]
MAPVTEAAIIAHGQPGNPAPMQAQIDDLAVRVAGELGGGWVVHGATLACGCSIRRAARASVVYPLFMAEGWFTQSEMPKRLQMAGADGYAMLRPLGLDPALPAIGLRLAREAAEGAGLDPAVTRLIVVGHGSAGKSRGSAEATRAFADEIAGTGAFATVECAFIEEPPFLHDLDGSTPAVCLPFFATPAEHTTEDIPEGLAAAGAPGPIAPPVGVAAEIPALIAAALRAAR